MWYKASAPGSLMLMGEHAVLHDHQAIVFAVDKRMTVTLKPRADEKIEVRSPRLGVWQTELSKLALTAPFHFVSASLCRHRDKLKSGFDLEITADFSDKMGLGSSAAVTVATLGVIFSWAGLSPTPLEQIQAAREIILEVQGLGSGADAAASVLGGVVAYRAKPLEFEKFTPDLPLTVLYSGYKTPTVEVIKQVNEKFANDRALFEQHCLAIQACVEEALLALRSQDWQGFGKAMNRQQAVMMDLGVSTPLLDEMIQQLRATSTIQGAKISGSGLGDCVIGLGKMLKSLMTEIPVSLAPEGLICSVQAE